MRVDLHQLVTPPDIPSPEAPAGPPKAVEPGRADAPRAEPPGERPWPPEPHRIALPETPQRTLSIRMSGDRRIYFQVIDRDTGEVVRQVPPDEILRLARSLADLLEAQQNKPEHHVDVYT